jgi:predicted signal transduction protein with EAL and GGDEF domain
MCWPRVSGAVFSVAKTLECALGIGIASEGADGRHHQKTGFQESARCSLPRPPPSGGLPSDLKFDVTEATLAKITLAQNDALRRLRILGAKVAIDNFGTEYSSFDYLRSYGVSELKMAQGFLSNPAQNPSRAATIRAI